MLSRRDLIKAGAAVAVTPLSHHGLDFLSVRPVESFSFAFFSDSHVGLKNDIPQDTEMLQEMAAHPVEFAINGGDITDYGWTGEYANYRELLKLVPFKVYAVPGNHDVRWSPLGPKAFKEGTDSPMYQSFEYKGCHFVVLNSTVPLSHYGHFESAMLRWLETDLKRVGKNTPVFIAFHHWVGRDGYQVDNEADLLRIIEPYNVKVLLTGHGHSDLLWTWNGIQCTMNKGLYQYSYERVDVDPAKGEIRLLRRTKEQSALTLIATVPLDRRTDRAPQAIGTSVNAGSTVKVSQFPGVTEYRWDDGKWQPLVAASVPTDRLTNGAHRLALRKDPATFFQGGMVNVNGGSGALRLTWDRKLSGGVMSHLRLRDGVLYISAMDGSLNAIRSRDGYVLWTARTGDYCHSSPLVLDDVVVVGSADGAIYAFERSNGKQRWKVPTGGPVYASAAFANGVLAIGSGDGKIYGLDPATGEQKWTTGLPASPTAFVQSPAATDGHRFYFGAWDTFLYALDARSGEMVWRQPTVLPPYTSFPYSPAIGGPVVGNGRVYVPANGNILWAFDSLTGDPSWHVKSPGEKFGYSSPCLVGDRIYIGCLGDNFGETRCLSARDGSEIWMTATGSPIYDSSFCHADGVVTIGSVPGLVTSLAADDGKILGQYRMPPGHILSSPVAEKGRVYAASLSDHVMAFDVIT